MTINCKGVLIDLNSPKVMGILNLTPNSFYDGGTYNDEKTILSQVQKMLDEGATFIDVGAYSSKPNADFVSEEEELQRLIPVIELLVNTFPKILISVDTFRSKVAENAIEAGAAIINDISAGSLDDNMFKTVAKLQVPYIIMHMKGTPNTMQNLTQYEDISHEMMYYFAEKIQIARSFGINDLIVDPGYGFAKTTEQNFEIMQKSEIFKLLNLPILVGISRKSMIYKMLNNNAKEALNGTIALNMVSLLKGAHILRVHDVKEAVETISLYQALSKNR